jgi:hypothetical protein
MNAKREPLTLSDPNEKKLKINDSSSSSSSPPPTSLESVYGFCPIDILLYTSDPPNTCSKRSNECEEDDNVFRCAPWRFERFTRFPKLIHLPDSSKDNCDFMMKTVVNNENLQDSPIYQLVSQLLYPTLVHPVIKMIMDFVPVSEGLERVILPCQTYLGWTIDTYIDRRWKFDPTLLLFDVIDMCLDDDYLIMMIGSTTTLVLMGHPLSSSTPPIIIYDEFISTDDVVLSLSNTKYSTGLSVNRSTNPGLIHVYLWHPFSSSLITLFTFQRKSNDGGGSGRKYIFKNKCALHIGTKLSKIQSTITLSEDQDKLYMGNYDCLNLVDKSVSDVHRYYIGISSAYFRAPHKDRCFMLMVESIHRQYILTDRQGEKTTIHFRFVSTSVKDALSDIKTIKVFHIDFIDVPAHQKISFLDFTEDRLLFLFDQNIYVVDLKLDQSIYRLKFQADDFEDSITLIKAIIYRDKIILAISSRVWKSMILVHHLTSV